MRSTAIFTLLALMWLSCKDSAPEAETATVPAIAHPAPEGNLFIIGGGKRPPALMKAFTDLAGTDEGYALVFAQSSAEPDTSFRYISEELAAHTDLPVIRVKNADGRQALIDSVRAAKLIFITGGDQNRFLRDVHTDVGGAIRDAYYRGATVGGTSAGAALMSRVMITGDQREELLYESTYSRLTYGNGVYAGGLGLTDSLIIDQHFVVRSRYNRLISALADTEYPAAAGIDESTALVITPGYTTVAGESQVVILTRPEQTVDRNGKIGLKEMKINIYLQGDTFKIKP